VDNEDSRRVAHDGLRAVMYMESAWLIPHCGTLQTPDMSATPAIEDA
jgi:hypothetical protein